jgi:F420-dependent oxidoreductase-like protein
MKIGLQTPNFTWPGGPVSIAGRLAAIARAAEAAGFASFWVMDHFFQIGGRDRSTGLGPAEDEMLECYTTLSYVAALTKRMTLGALVTAGVYRHPGVLIKTVTTLDVLSGGRAYLGIGAAWNEREARGLGIPFPPLKERFEKLEETLRIAHQLWAGKREPFEGRYFRLEEPIINPLPLTKPHPPILVGGSGERKTLRLVAQYADACNLFAGRGLDTLRGKIDVLKRHCEQVGRDFDEIEKTTLGTVHLAPGKMGVPDVIQLCQELAALGVQHAIFNMPNVHEITPLETFGREIIPAVAGL